jgi:hypothetical protein
MGKVAFRALPGRRKPAATLGLDDGNMDKGREEKTEGDLRREESSPGIVVTDRPGGLLTDVDHPRIAAFIWGGKVPPTPTLPYGRWRGAA